MSETLYQNTVPTNGLTALSIVTPFHKNDPTILLDILAKQARGLAVELIIIDDGSCSECLTNRVEAIVDRFEAPALLITCNTNQGRSAARNRLISQASAPYILFLDSDMAPDSDTFLKDWLDLIEKAKPSIAYGGFSTLQVPQLPKLALARALAERNDCHSADERTQRGALAVATSNLLVRADIMHDVRFDSDFQGWGWEDVDWALRAEAAGYEIRHVPIPATHMGLDVPAVLLDKFAKAGPNFRKILERHPAMHMTQGTKLAKVLRHMPFKGRVRQLLKATALNEKMPIKWRSGAARIWRALWAIQK